MQLVKAEESRMDVDDEADQPRSNGETSSPIGEHYYANSWDGPDLLSSKKAVGCSLRLQMTRSTFDH